MNRLTDSTSDSDSNSSTSWIFVDESNAENKEANKYYLNCSSEPVQELTEKCLNSAGSDIETDSDGISVISESDSNVQILQYDDLSNSSEETGKEVIETVCDSAIILETAINPLNTHHESKKSILWYVMFTSILVLALIVPLFLSDDELIENDSLNGCETKVDNKFYNYDNNLDIDAMAFNNIHQLNDCQSDYNCNSELYPKSSKMFEDKKAGKNYDAKENDKLYEKNYKRNENNKKLHSNKKIKFSKKNIEMKKRQFDGYKDSKCNSKKETHKNHQYYDKEIKKRQNQLKKLEKSLKKKETELNEMKRQLKNLKSKISKELNFLHAFKKNKYKENKTCFDKEKKLLKMKRFNVSLMGDWYNNLYSERDKMRKQEQMANWIFERADMRSKKRNKAIWYFNWMTEREQLRFKKDFKQFSY